jgi:uncharacterized membrane protein YqgA involved in biofilm formation
MRKTDSLIFLGILMLLIILALFAGAIIGEKIGYQRGLAEAEKTMERI